MTLRSRAACRMVAAAAVMVCAGAAHAVCIPQAASIAVTPTSVNTGTYTAPTAPSAVAINIVVTGTYVAIFGGNCIIAVAFNRATIPAFMTQIAGTATLPYEITSASGGGNSLIYTSGIPAAGNRLTATFPALGFLVTTPFILNFTAYARMLPGSGQAGGSYLDSITLDVFNLSSGGGSLMRAQAFSVTGTVSKSCTIGGLSNPAADSVTIPISSAGAVTTTAINRSYGSVSCNYPSNVQLTSLNGGVLNSASAPGGFGRIINYASSATFSGASATLDTSTNPAATGAESGAASSTSGGAPSGTMSVVITPQASAQPLISGSYSDTLRITITPQ